MEGGEVRVGGVTVAGMDVVVVAAPVGEVVPVKVEGGCGRLDGRGEGLGGGGGPSLAGWFRVWSGGGGSPGGGSGAPGSGGLHGRFAGHLCYLWCFVSAVLKLDGAASVPVVVDAWDTLMKS